VLKDVLDEIAINREAHRWLLPPLLESLAHSREVPPPKHDTWFSASRVPTMCPKALVLTARMGLPMADNTDARARWSMDRGSALHAMFQSYWLGPTGWLLGGWACRACSKLHGGVGEDRWSIVLENAVPLPERCDRCGAVPRRQEPWQFVEPYAADNELRVRGRTDGFLRMPSRGFEVMDLKFTARLDLIRVAPKADHVAQLHWYLGASSLKTGRIVYVDPGAKSVEEAMVEHPVAFDARLMHQEKEKVRATREALSDERRPVPACPYGGKGAYGECPCVEVAVLWARSRR